MKEVEIVITKYEREFSVYSKQCDKQYVNSVFFKTKLIKIQFSLL